MQNILPSIKGFKELTRSTILLLIFIFASVTSIAQTTVEVSITVNILPPYSPYYSDYSGANAGKVLLIVRNLTNTQKRIKLTGELNGTNGIKINTKSTYVPLQPIILQPNETKQLNGTALKDIFDLNSLNVYGVDKVKLVQTSRLPEGDYTFCLQAVDLNTNKVITNTSPQGCTTFNISYPNAPILVSPVAFEKIEAKYNRTTTQNIIFSWMNPGTVPMNTQYIIQIAEMANIPIIENGRVTGYSDNAKDPNQILNSTSLYVLNQRITGTSYVYGMGNRPLTVGKKYAWRVIASDPSNRTGFMNDGKSGANVFIYGSLEQLAASNPALKNQTELLNIVSPSCKNGVDELVVGPNMDLSFKWLWKEQIESAEIFGALDTNLLKHYSKVNVTPVKQLRPGQEKEPDVFENIKYYRYEFTRKGGNMITSKLLYVPKQTLKFTQSEVVQLGLVTGQSYKLKVNAVSDKNTIIASAETCYWLLKAEPVSQIPALTIKGKLNYTFEGKNFYGARKTSIMLQFVSSKSSKIESYSYVNVNGKYVMKPVAYVTTDVEGNFVAKLDQLAIDTGDKHLAIFINGGYYKQIDNALLVKIPKIGTQVNGGVVNYIQDTLNVDFKTEAYNYTLTVNLKKGFSTVGNANSLYNAYKEQFGQEKALDYLNQMNAKLNVDTLSINPKAKVDAGILVGIYRKAKKDYTPTYEGDIVNKAPLFPLKNTDTRVAEARTFIQGGQTIVVFNKLLISTANDDEYYIKAILPKADPNKPSADNNADLVAPEQRVAFKPTYYNNVTSSYATTVNYQIISTKPPTAKIKGTIMQQWPSRPGVLHPYANKEFTIKMYTKTPITGAQSLDAGNCQTYLAEVVQKTKDANGNDKWINAPAANDEYTVAAGKTDANGNYELEILDFKETGTFDLEIRKASNVKQGLTCAQQAVADEKAIRDKLAAQINTIDVSQMPLTVAELKALIALQEQLKGGNLGDNGSAGGGDFKFDTNGGFSATANNAATQLLAKFGRDSNGKLPTGGGWTNPTQTKANDLLKMGGIVKNILQLDLGVTTNKYNFVAEDVEPIITGLNNNLIEETVFSELKAIDGQLERYFKFNFTPTNPKLVSTINNDGSNTIDKFTVPPFGSINLGISVIDVNEIRELKLKFKAVAKQANGQVDKNTNVDQGKVLAGARMVIYRTVNSLPKDKIIPGEGSLTHPVKPLISDNYSSKGADVEWVLDLPLEINSADYSFNLGNLRLSNEIGGPSYFYLITPPPTGETGRFLPFRGPLYKSPKLQEITVDLAPSRIAGRVKDASTQQPIKSAVPIIVKVEIFDDKKKFKAANTFPIDENGYFELVNGKNALSWQNNDYVRAYAIVDGYNNTDTKPGNGTGIYELTPSEKATFITRQLDKDGKNINLEINKLAGGYIRGTVFGLTTGKPPKGIEAYIETEGGAIQSTDKQGNYGFFTAAKKQNFKVIPLDNGYLEHTFSEEVPTSTPSSPKLKTINLLRREHRMIIDLVDEKGIQIPVGDLKVTINNEASLSETNKIVSYQDAFNKTISSTGVKFNFENVSVNNYDVKITSASKTVYIPKLVKISNKESVDYKATRIVVEKGSVISGKVTLNGQPAKNARVYVHYNTADEKMSSVPVFDKSAPIKIVNGLPVKANEPDKTINQAALEDFTDEYGNYDIKGLPAKDGETIKIHATMEASFAVNGSEQDVTITSGVGKADFALTTFNGPLVKDIYGFPLAVEKIEKLSETQFSVTGIVDLSKNNSSLAWSNSDAKLRVSNIVVNANNNYQPVGAVTIDAIANLKMRYLDKYNVLLRSENTATNKGLKIEKTDNGGAVKGTVSIIDNSFNYPSSHLNFDNAGDFYLSTVTNSAANTVVIPAIYVGAKKNEKFNLSNVLGQDLKFSFINFTTTANAKTSYIGTDGKFHLDIKFKKDLPDSETGSIDINVKDLVLDGTTIEAKKSTDPITYKLQTWDVEVKDWVVDVQKGGVFSTNAIVRTGILDVPAKTFNLRSDQDPILKDFDVSNVYLGGDMVKLENIAAGTVNLVLDQAVGSDHGKHWRFSGVRNDGNAVANIKIPVIGNKDFPGLDLKVNYFQFISYANENLISLSSAQSSVKLYNNDKLLFSPVSIASYKGEYRIGGSLKIALPRINPVNTDLIFKNDKTFKVGSFDLNFEGKGYVQFKNTAGITNNNGLVTIEGTVEEPKKISAIKSKLTFSTTQNGKISLDNQDVDLVGVGSLKIEGKPVNNSQSDGMMVESNDWTTLKFSGPLTYDNALKAKEKPFMRFEVLGEVTANSDKITMENTNSLGTMKLVYDMPNKQMTGSLRMDNVAFGSYTFTGDIEVGYGGQGFLMLGAGQLNTGILLVDGFGTFNIGMVFANKQLSSSSITKVTQFSQAPDNLCWLNDNKDKFTGFFLSGGYDILNVKEGIDLGVASIYYAANLGVEASIGVNFHPQKTGAMALIGAHGKISAGMSAITGTSVSGSVNAHLTAAAGYSNSAFTIDGRAGITLNYDIKQSLLVKTLTFSGSVDARVLFHYEQPSKTSLKFELKKDGLLPPCPIN